MGLLIATANKTKLKNQTIILVGTNVAYARSENDIDAKAELSKICKKVEGDKKKAKGFGLK